MKQSIVINVQKQEHNLSYIFHRILVWYQDTSTKVRAFVHPKCDIGLTHSHSEYPWKVSSATLILVEITWK